MFNDYKHFTPQHAMLKYVNINGKPVRKNPYRVKSDEWVSLVKECFFLDPTNLDRKSIIRDGAWIKSVWTEIRGQLAEAFKSYNRSGKHDGVTMGDWCSREERERWKRSAMGKSKKLRFNAVLVYSAAVLEEGDLNRMGREMPKGTGRDSSIAVDDDDVDEDTDDNEAESQASKRRRGSYAKKTTSAGDDDLAKVMENTAKIDQQVKGFENILKYSRDDRKTQYALEQMERLANLLPTQTWDIWLDANQA